MCANNNNTVTNSSSAAYRTFDVISAAEGGNGARCCCRISLAAAVSAIPPPPFGMPTLSLVIGTRETHDEDWGWMELIQQPLAGRGKLGSQKKKGGKTLIAATIAKKPAPSLPLSSPLSFSLPRPLTNDLFLLVEKITSKYSPERDRHAAEAKSLD